MNLHVVISDQVNPHLNVAVENYLVAQNTPDVITLYLWKNRRTVVIGQNQNPYTECNVDQLLADGGYLMRRRTGGGAVYHDDGNINFSFIVPTACYDQTRQFGVLMNAVASFGLHCEVSGRNDVLCEGRKFSGNAFSRGRYNNLHHGTILIDTNTDDMHRYLKVKASKLSRHGVASVQSRVVNLAELAPITSENIVQPLIEAFEREYQAQSTVIPFAEITAMPDCQQLYSEFASEEWIFASWRTFNSRKQAQFDWGQIEIDYTIDETTHSFNSISISTDSLWVDVAEVAQKMLVGASTTQRPVIPSSLSNEQQWVLGDILALIYD